MNLIDKILGESTLTTNEKLILLYLLRNNGRPVTQLSIASSLSMKFDTAHRSIRRLIKMNCIIKVVIGGRLTSYTLTTENNWQLYTPERNRKAS